MSRDNHTHNLAVPFVVGLVMPESRSGTEHYANDTISSMIHKT